MKAYKKTDFSQKLINFFFEQRVYARLLFKTPTYVVKLYLHRFPLARMEVLCPKIRTHLPEHLLAH